MGWIHFRAVIISSGVLRPIEHETPHYVVDDVTENDTLPSDFEKGVEVILWNKMSITQVVERMAERNDAANYAARMYFAIYSLTERLLDMDLFPDENVVTVKYINKTGVLKQAAFEWMKCAVFS